MNIEANFLQGKISKYGSTLVGKGKLETSIDMNINGSFAVTPYQEIKLLGINIDHRLSFTNHISKICKKTSRRVGVVMGLRKLTPTNAKLALYKAAILPHMTYCNTVWLFCKCTDSRKLERIQERALRAIYCDWNASYEQLLKWANLPTLRNRRLLDITIIMYKVKSDICPTNISDLFVKSQSKYNLRIKEFEILHFNHINYGKNSVRYIGLVLWARLPEDLRNSPSLSSFKRSVRKLNLEDIIRSDCYYSFCK